MLMRTSISSFGCIVLVAALGCSADDHDGPGKVYPLPQDLDAIDLSYLPYEYSNDGCEYRSSYLGMELLAQGIPSFVVAAEDCEQDLSLRPPGGARWRFHESVAIWRGDDARIVEPVFSSDYLTLDDWLDTMVVDPVNVYLSSVGNPPSYTRSEGGCDLRPSFDDAPHEISEMAPWTLSNTMIFCSYMRRHLLDSPLYDEAREERLIKRTYELLDVVRKHGLLTEDDSEAIAHLAKGPWCPPAIPSK